jgi:hypothetical protein
MSENPKTVSHLLNLIRNSYAEYETLLNSIPSERLLEPMMGDWSVKDVVAHVTWSEREMIPVVREMRLQGSELWNLPTDERNKLMVEDSRMKTASEIMDEQRNAHRDLIAAIEALEDADLTENARLKEAPPGWTLWELLAGNTFRHYPEHVENLQEFLAHGHIDLEHDPRTKAGLIERMERERDKIEEFIGSLNDEQLTRAGSDGWSIKDFLAHMAVWEAGIVALLQKKPRWEAMGLTRDFVRANTEDQVNAKLEEAAKTLSLAEVKGMFANVHREMLSVLQSLSDDDLMRPYSDYDSASESKAPIMESILGNTSHHWFQHRQWLKDRVGNSNG